MAKIVTLKKNDEYVYPVTTGEAVIGAVYTDDLGVDEPAQPWVSGDMIDFSSIVFVANDPPVSATVGQVIQSLTVPAGKYIIHVTFRGYTGNFSASNTFAIGVDGSNVTTNPTVISSTIRPNISTDIIRTYTAPHTINVTVDTAVNISPELCSLYAIKIG